MRDELDTVHTFSNVVNVAFGASTGFVTFKTLQAASTAAQVVQHRCVQNIPNLRAVLL
jgi:hypothetical protein